jgi:hypothetical protein
MAVKNKQFIRRWKLKVSHLVNFPAVSSTVMWMSFWWLIWYISSFAVRSLNILTITVWWQPPPPPYNIFSCACICTIWLKLIKESKFGSVSFVVLLFFPINKKPANGANTFYGVQHVPFMLSFLFFISILYTKRMNGVSLSTNREAAPVTSSVVT